MTTTDAPAAAALPFHQPKVWLRWLAVVLAIVGWWLSLQLFLASGSRSADGGLLDVLCGGADQADAGWDCRSVLSSRHGHVALSRQKGALEIPVSSFGLAYFAFVGLWYLFIGPPTHGRRVYHLVIAAVVLCGIWSSIDFIRIMAFELHQWCGACLATHAVNGGLLAITIAAWPWRRPGPPQRQHPTGRLALATVTAGLLAGVCHLVVIILIITGGNMKRVADAYRKIIDDPQYVLWEHQRQPLVDIPLYADEVFGGSPLAPNTVVVFGDFQCTQCRVAHKELEKIAAARPGALRIAYRYWPQDPACNPHPNFKAGGHRLSCKAARACEAARIVGGPDAQAALRKLLFERQTEIDLDRFAEWATELGLNGEAFEQALNSEAAANRIESDIALGTQLEILGVPILYLNGRRLVGWSNRETWDALLGEATAATTQAAPAP